MGARLLERLLWDKHLTPRAERVWFVLIAAAPLALLVATWLQWRLMSAVPARATTPTSVMLDQTHTLARQLGLETRGWEEKAFVTSNPEDSAGPETYRYLVAQGEAGRRALVEDGLWSRIRVQLREPDSTQFLDVWFTPSGKQTGFRWKPTSHTDSESIPESDAKPLADKRLREMLSNWPAVEADGNASHATSDGEKDHIFRWKLRTRGLPDLDGEATVRLHERTITQASVEFFLANKARKQYGEAFSRSTLRTIFISYAFLLAIYSFVRYFKRRTQREVSRQRMLLVAGIIGVALFADFYLESSDVFKINPGDGMIPQPVILAIVALGMFTAGMVAGVCYSATEGDLREVDPRRITSVDALLAGKIVSRNVGRSVVLGVVALAWTSLLYNVVYRLAQPVFPGSETLFRSFGIVYSKLPWVSLLLSATSAAVFVPLVAIFAPAGLVWRRIRRPKVALVLLVAATVIPLALLSREPFDLPVRIVLAAISASGLLLSFLLVDLLAAIVYYAGTTTFVSLIALSVTAPAWKEHELLALLVALGIIGVASACAFTGRAVDEAAVRPDYARDIEERMLLESEVEAAREAQQRLLPVAAPPVEGITVAASCQAAASVSGDFYDFFVVGNQRLGVLISDGGGNGLATALMIAFAKGFLMEKAQAGWSAVQTLRALEATLGEQLEGVSTEGLFYAVIDAAEGTCRYARIGATPGVFVAGSDETVHEVRHQGEYEFWEGYVRLSPTSRLVLYTNGVCRLIGEPDRVATNRWLSKRIGKRADQPASGLHDWIVKTVFTKRVGRGRRVAEEDVTVLVVGVNKTEPAAVEHVA